MSFGGFPTALTFLPDGRRLAVSVMQQARVQFLLLPERAYTSPSLAHRVPVMALAATADGRRLLTASKGPTAHVWDAVTGRAEGPALDHRARVNGLAVTSATNSLANVFDGLTINLTKVTTTPVQVTVAQDKDGITKAVQGFVDAYGRAVDEPEPKPARTVTRVTRREAAVAVVSHAGSVAGLIKEMGPAMRLGLENERLQAEVLARLGELRESRARIVQASDDERRTLEKNLHDGAQQQLLALSYNLRLARASAAARSEPAAEVALVAAMQDAQQALEELRDLAHGIYPAVLMEAGLTPALESLADSAPVVVQIKGRDQRFPTAVENTFYFVAVDALTDAIERGATLVTIVVAHDDHRISMVVQDDGSARTSRMVSLADRVGALDGTVALESNICGVEVPCDPLHDA